MKKWSVRRLLFLFCVVFYLINFSSYADILIPEWDIPYINQDIKVDGELNESAYKKAFKYNNFFQTEPGYNIKPSEKTELYIFVNNKGIVFGIVCHEVNNKISLQKYRRDEFITRDGVSFSIDTEGNAKKFYVLGISPTNCVWDGLNDDTTNLDFDFSFEHATKIYKDRYVIEILIPFSSLNYSPKAEQKWLIGIERNIAREVFETDSLWKDVRDLNDPRTTMVYIKFKLPESHRQSKRKKLKLIPSLVVSHLKHNEEFFGSTDNYNSDKGDLGLTVEYSPSTNTVFKGTIHPDFSQVEADDTYQRVNNRYPVYLREKRPFFMDGMESFSTPFELLYTRRIVKPEYGLKFSTKLKNKYGIYLISAMEKDVPSERFGYSDEFKKDVYWNVVRSTYSFDKKGSFIGFMGIVKNYGSDYNSVASADGTIKKGNLTLSFQGVITKNKKKNESETGNALNVSVNYLFSDYLNAGISYDGISPDFKDDAGFFDRNNERSYTAYCSLVYNPKTDKGFITFSSLMFLFQNNYNYQSQLFDQIGQITLFMNLRHRVFIFVNLNKNSNLFYQNKVFETHSGQINIGWSKYPKLSPGFSYWQGTDVLYGNNPVLANVKSYSVSLSSSFSSFKIVTSFFIYKYTDRLTDETIRKQKALQCVGTYFFNDHTNFKVFYISDLADIRDYNYNQPYHYINLLFTWRKNAFTKLYIGYNNGHSTYRMTDKTMWGFERDKYLYAKITYLF